MGLKLFYEILLNLPMSQGCFFVRVVFWGCSFVTAGGWALLVGFGGSFWVSLGTSTLKQSMMSENLDLFKSVIESSIPQSHGFIQS